MAAGRRRRSRKRLRRWVGALEPKGTRTFRYRRRTFPPLRAQSHHPVVVLRRSLDVFISSSLDCAWETIERTVMLKTAAEVDTAEYADDEADYDECDTEGHDNGEERPLCECPAESCRVEHGSPADDVGEGQKEEDSHGDLHLATHREPTTDEPEREEL